ncbi:MAG: phenylalanine--tRNA ligase beta subunit-related protein [Actinomycetota bacterium]
MTRSQDDLEGWADRISVDSAIFEFCPDYCAGLMVVGGLVSGPTDATAEAALVAAEERMQEPGDDEAASAQVERWLDAFRSFGAKPKRTRPSADALRRRAAKGGLPRINRVTDLYNAISVVHGVPIGVEDVDHYDGDLRLVRAVGDETFATTDHGEPIIETVDAGEPIWRDDTGATCRRWNWRQTTRTALTETTVNAVFIVDTLGPDAEALAATVLDELRSSIAPDADPIIRTIHAAR